MRPIGFSTGALALGDFDAALGMLKGINTKVVELSALREREVSSLMTALPHLELSRFAYVSVHVPSKFETLTEADIAVRLRPCIERQIPIVIHPDVIRQKSCWEQYGSLLCIENMDKRKATGRTLKELQRFFEEFPEATFCLDVAHARQIDSTMGEAREMLIRFGDRLRQVHISEIDDEGRHHSLSLASILADAEIASMIKPDVPVIIESQIGQQDMEREIEAVERALTPPERVSSWKAADWGALA